METRETNARVCPGCGDPVAEPIGTCEGCGRNLRLVTQFPTRADFDRRQSNREDFRNFAWGALVTMFLSFNYLVDFDLDDGDVREGLWPPAYFILDASSALVPWLVVGGLIWDRHAGWKQYLAMAVCYLLLIWEITS